MRAGWRVMVGLSGLGAVAAPTRAAQAQQAPAGALAVPYLAQSELLCGGAAIAMVERWWGRRRAFAEDFAPLVRADEGGIRTTDLAAATRARGWDVRTLRGTPALVTQALADSIPVVALIEVGRDRYHYVVLVDWNDSTVTFHDPAVAPYIRQATSTFLAQWQAADDWALVMVPIDVPEPSPDPVAGPPLPCPPWLPEAADAAARNDLSRARALIDSAAARCPGEPLIARELAGVRFRQGDHAAAARLAREYLELMPGDTLAWRLLAAARWLTSDHTGALAAWSRVGHATLDLIVVRGLDDIRFRVVSDATGLALGTSLTSDRLAIARRRVADIPALATSRVSYVPVPGGLVELHAAVVERSRWPTPPRLLLGGARAAFGGVAEVELGSLAGAGETWDAVWRWRSANPEVAIQLDVPTNPGRPIVIGVGGEWEEWRFDAVTPDARRRAATVDARTWWSGTVESRAAVRHERWRDGREALAFGTGLGLHDSHDRVAVIVDAEQAFALSDHGGYRRARFEAGWRSGSEYLAPVVALRIGAIWVDRATPVGLRPVAGGDAGRAVPLRAHRWDRDDRLPVRRIGRAVLHGGLSVDRDVGTIGPFVLGAGVFADAAGVFLPASASDEDAWYLDAGIGLRLGLPGGEGGTVRFDLARGLAAEPQWGVSVALERPWPFRTRGID